MKKLLKTLCAFALVIPIIFTSACKTKKNDEIPDPSNGTPPAEENTSTEESTLFDGTIYKIAEIDTEEIDWTVAFLFSTFTELLEDTTIKIGNNGSFELSSDIKSGISGMVQTVSGTCTDNNNVLTIAEPKATSENFVLGQKVSSSEADAENFKKNITQDFDFKYAGNKNYIIATLNDTVPFVFIKDGYTTTQAETLGHASLLKESVYLSTNTYQDLLEYVSPYLVLVCNKSGTVTLECMDLDNCVAVTGIDSQSPSPNSFESTYLTEGNYENVQLHFDLNNDSQTDTSFNIGNVTVYPASSRLDFYRYVDDVYWHYSSSNKLHVERGCTESEFLEECPWFYCIDNGEKFALEEEMISIIHPTDDLSTDVIIKLEIPDNSGGIINHTILAYTHSFESVANGTISNIDLVGHNDQECEFLTLLKGENIETAILKHERLKVSYSSHISFSYDTSLALRNNTLTFSNVDTSSCGYKVVTLTYTELGTTNSFSKNYLVAVTDSSHNAPYRYVIASENQASNTCTYVTSVPSGTDLNALASRLNNITFEVRAQYLDGSIGNTVYKTISLKEIIGVTSITAENLSAGNYKNKIFTIPIEVVGDGFESYTYDAYISLSFYVSSS